MPKSPSFVRASPRAIAPGPSPTMDVGQGESSAAGARSGRGSSPRRRVSVACTCCKKSKRKCSGVKPCDNCVANARVCLFDETLDNRRRVAAKRTSDNLTYFLELCHDLFRIMRSDDKIHGRRLMQFLHDGPPINVARDPGRPDEQPVRPEFLRAFLDEVLFDMGLDPAFPGEDGGVRSGSGGGGGGGTGAAVAQTQEMPADMDVEGPTPGPTPTPGPSSHPQVMDIHYLCNELLYRVPAAPWTSVTDNADLVSHLVSLYFTWDYPFNLFLDRDVFLRHMASGDLRSDLCSPFLVNALLTNACYYSDYSETYVNTRDVVSKGARFLAEAERLWKDELAIMSLPFLQGTLMLYVRYSIAGADDMGYRMLHQAIWTGESLGLIGPGRPMPNPSSEDMMISFQKTAWGLFNIDAIVHPNLLRPTIVGSVNVPRPPGARPDEVGTWKPYPSDRPARPSHFDRYFEASCELSQIARDMSQALFPANSPGLAPAFRSQAQETIYDRLQAWLNRLPEAFHPDRRPPPYILLLSMRYHCLIIALVSLRPQSQPSSHASVGPQTPVSPPGLSPLSTVDPGQIIQESARAISILAWCYRREYSMKWAHHFALFALNLALFVMANGPAFDILAPEFLSLASSFADVAGCSQLGRNLLYLFHVFVCSRGQSYRIRHSGDISDELKMLLDDEPGVPSPWGPYTAGLNKLDVGHYGGVPPRDGEWSLLQMLDCYESLSLGKDEVAPVRFPDGF
ncbi:C6 transcription factor [Aspergillus campestris IBT 28561]|uniref:C6 transcription factor n=1 Tax=Aspergillus campestris (strain IBT 28561) TaxID=1392248 RepID=A0A2I1CSC8_ASPC2|nr:C6 transcription factor [Aspergillus campestris IBT 28561]PKY00540.1 C6 transcription factor [Aspergillus campestris IBT 28561]